MTFDIYNDPLEFYEFLLTKTLSSIYVAKRQTQHQDFLKFSNLIIDKFAIHSASFFHLSSGIIEHRLSNEKIKMKGYDLFSVNALFRTLMENYATFNHIFIEAKSYEEQKFRFLLWKIDGLSDKEKFDLKITDFEQAEKVINSDKEKLSKTTNEFENCDFYKSLDKNELKKIYKPGKKYSWRFIISDNKIQPLKIIDLIKHTCRIRAFINTYRYTSIHTHTNYLAIEHFEQTRGKQISREYTDPITRLAIYLTCFMICDICTLDKKATLEFENLPSEIKHFIRETNNAIRL